MIPELGYFCLLLALCFSVVQIIFPLIGAVKGNAAYLLLGRFTAVG
ncbi:MAG: hypothetical protein JSR33_10325, partial [Proteobacteria bacterium]|nr:hypothetical protein [Pseudomonadota bacterium]